MGATAPEALVRLLDKVPSLRLVMDHLPGLTYRLKEFGDKAAMASYVRNLQELGKRPNVYIKLSEVVRPIKGKVFFVSGGEVGLFEPFTIVERIRKDGRWTVEELEREAKHFADVEFDLGRSR